MGGLRDLGVDDARLGGGGFGRLSESEDDVEYALADLIVLSRFEGTSLSVDKLLSDERQGTITFLFFGRGGQYWLLYFFFFLFLQLSST